MIRVHELAKELGISNQALMVRLTAIGEFVRGGSSPLTNEVAAQLRGGEPPDGTEPEDEPKAMSMHDAAALALRGELGPDHADYLELRARAIDGLVALYMTGSLTVSRDRIREVGLSLGGQPSRFSLHQRWVSREIPSGAPGLGKRS